MNKYPDNNPKTLVGASKVPLHLVPPSAVHYLADALADGARKYGAYNWRSSPISISTYKSALQRHMDAFWDGEDLASDSGVHHVAHAMACCALILDAMSLGVLVDDRPPKGKASELQQNYVNKEANKTKKEEVLGTSRILSLAEAAFGRPQPPFGFDPDEVVLDWLPHLQAYVRPTDGSR